LALLGLRLLPRGLEALDLLIGVAGTRLLRHPLLLVLLDLVVDDEAGDAAEDHDASDDADQELAKLLLRLVVLQDRERPLVLLLRGHRREPRLLLGLEPR